MAYSTINKPEDYFNTKLYTGNDTSQSITGVGFQPDWTWIKCRSNNEDHAIFDSVRGATEYLASSLKNAEDTRSASLTSFDSDGFSLGSGNYVNDGSQTFASWNWLADGSASSNTDGSITSQVSANTTSGFSIVSYEGTGSAATVGHGLGAIPKMIIVKDRSTASTNWVVHHKDVTAGNLYLNSNGAVGSGKDVGENATSSVFDITTWDNVNGSGDNYIAYCFAEKKGFSKFGSYTGNGSTDGPFIYTGFRPAWVMVKVYSGTTGRWYIFDNKRNVNNAVDKYLAADSDNVEATSDTMDFCSTGFKFRSSNAAWNGSGNGHIYMAFAERSLVGTNNVPALAR